MRDLERALQNAGLSTDSGSLNFSLKDQGRSSPFAYAFDEPEAESTTVLPELARGAHAASRSANGRLDIQV
jgi:hypothetical protein